MYDFSVKKALDLESNLGINIINFYFEITELKNKINFILENKGKTTQTLTHVLDFNNTLKNECNKIIPFFITKNTDKKVFNDEDISTFINELKIATTFLFENNTKKNIDRRDAVKKKFIWYVVYATEKTNLSYSEVLEMKINTLINYILQLNYLFEQKERTKMTTTDLQKFMK